MRKYFRKWRLQPNARKKYPGITLDMTLSFKEHQTETAEKL